MRALVDTSNPKTLKNALLCENYTRKEKGSIFAEEVAYRLRSVKNFAVRRYTNVSKSLGTKFGILKRCRGVGCSPNGGTVVHVSVYRVRRAPWFSTFLIRMVQVDFQNPFFNELDPPPKKRVFVDIIY